MAKKLDLTWRELDRFSTLQKTLNSSLKELIEHADHFIDQQLYSRQDICEQLEISDTDLNEKLLSSNTRHLNEFKLRQRTLHVFQGNQLTIYKSVRKL